MDGRVHSVKAPAELVSSGTSTYIAAQEADTLPPEDTANSAVPAAVASQGTSVLRVVAAQLDSVLSVTTSKFALSEASHREERGFIPGRLHTTMTAAHARPGCFVPDTCPALSPSTTATSRMTARLQT